MSKARQYAAFAFFGLILIGGLAGYLHYIQQGSLFPSPAGCEPVTLTNPETSEPFTGDSLQDAVNNWEQAARQAGKTQSFVDNYRGNVNFVFNEVNGTQALQIKNTGCGTQTVKTR